MNDVRIKGAELASRISAHLRRFEADPEVNKPHPLYRTKKYFNAYAVRVGSRIHVSYISYQASVSLTFDQARKYLAWLDAGNVGTHYRMEVE